MQDSESSAGRQVARRLAEKVRRDRAEHLRELLRSDLRALHDLADDCEISLDQLKIIIDSGDPTASIIAAICEIYQVSSDFVIHAFEKFDEEAMGMALEIVMGSAAERLIPTERGVRSHPDGKSGTVLTARSKYRDAVTLHIANHASRHYETFASSIRMARMEEAKQRTFEERDFIDPWDGQDAEIAPLENVRHLPTRNQRQAHLRPKN